MFYILLVIYLVNKNQCRSLVKARPHNVLHSSSYICSARLPNLQKILKLQSRKRSARLATESIAKRQQRASETDSQRVLRLQQLTSSRENRVASESNDQRAARLLTASKTITE